MYVWLEVHIAALKYSTLMEYPRNIGVGYSRLGLMACSLPKTTNSLEANSNCVTRRYCTHARMWK
jgi:hypothetical protein